MNRIIKFRGKRVDNGEIVFGDLIHGQGGKSGRMYILPQTRFYPPDCNNLDGYEVIPETVGQLIGSTDKNGKEIYEWDVVCKEHIVKRYNEDHALLTPQQLSVLYPENFNFYVVCWVEGEDGFALCSLINGQFDNRYADSSTSGINKMFIAGNIHDLKLVD